MSNRPLISIIVPVYNMEKYLNRCVDSILGQRYDNIELILVDDGSTDSSFDICKNYQSKDSRVTAIHKENGGQGSARNIGLDIAKGDYIGFVDSDDLLLEDMYETLLSLLMQYDADVSTLKTFHFNDEAELKERDENTEHQSGVFTGYEALKERFSTGLIVTDSPCNKLYKKELFKDLRFLENRLLDDTALTYKILDKANKIAYTDKCGYLVRCENTSVSRRKYNVRRCDTILTYREIVDFIERQDKYKDLYVLVESAAAGAVFYNAGEFYKAKIKDKKTKNFIKESAAFCLKTYKHLTKKDKVLLRLIKNSFSVYGMIYKLKH